MQTIFWRTRATFSGFGRDVNLLLLATGILAISFFGIQMLLKILYVLHLGYGPAYLGMFNAAGALGYMAMSLPAPVSFSPSSHRSGVPDWRPATATAGP